MPRLDGLSEESTIVKARYSRYALLFNFRYKHYPTWDPVEVMQSSNSESLHTAMAKLLQGWHRSDVHGNLQVFMDGKLIQVRLNRSISSTS